MAHTYPDTGGSGGLASDQMSERLDELYEALAHGYRRLVLVYLASADQPVQTEKLADVIADCEGEATADRVHIELHHRHLPRLEAADCIELDEASVQKGEAAGRALDLLECT